MGHFLGVDLGQAFSAVVLREAAGQAHPIRFSTGGNGRGLPTAVAYPEHGRPVCGVDSRPWLVERPRRLVAGWKRLLGLSYEHPAVTNALMNASWHAVSSPSGEIMVQLDDDRTPLPLTEVAAALFSYVRNNLPDTPSARKAAVSLTVPHGFEAAQVEAVTTAARLAGWQQPRVFGEGDALVVALAERSMFNDCLAALCDLGAGKFEVTVAEFGSAGAWRRLISVSEPLFGSDDIDNAICDAILERLEEKRGVELRRNAFARDRALDALRAARPALATCERVELHLPFLALKRDGAPLHARCALEQSTYQALLEPFMERIAAVCRRALEELGIDRYDLRGNVLATRGYSDVPMYARTIAEVISAPRFAEEKHWIAYGATLLAEQPDASEEDV